MLNNSRELLAVDGTRIKAVNNRDRNFTAARLERELQASDERLERYLEQLDGADTTEAGSGAPHAPNFAEKIAAVRERRTTLTPTQRFITKRYNTTPANLSNWIRKRAISKPRT